MTCVVNGQTQGLCPSYMFSSTTNQIKNANCTSDSSGDLTQNGTGTGAHTYQWDAESRMVSVDGVAGQAFNVLNHMQLQTPFLGLQDPADFGVMNGASGSAYQYWAIGSYTRVIQLRLRVSF